MSMFFLLLSFFLVFLSFFLGKKMIFLRQKSSSFECGFDPRALKMLSFSVRFFAISVIFLVFDVEISLIMPISSFFFSGSSPLNFVLFMMLIFILWVGTLQEWGASILEWKE